MNKLTKLITLAVVLFSTVVFVNAQCGEKMDKTSIYDIKVKNIDGEEISMSEYKGKTLLIVNVASKCGYTPQYEGLEKLYKDYKDKGLVILGFPCNQFAGQEPGSEKEILEFCQTNYGVTFPMFSKIDVNGENTHPLYVYLKKEAPGVLSTQDIKWNFTKFLVSADGKVLQRFAPATTPAQIDNELKKIIK